MKKFRFWAFASVIALFTTACGGGGGGSESEKPLDPEPSKPVEEIDPPINEPSVAPNARIDDGRHVTAYVTYYGSLIPDASVLTHINYAFAELYMVDGIYKKFDHINGEIEIFPIGAVIGSHTGPGTIALFFWGTPRKD